MTFFYYSVVLTMSLNKSFQFVINHTEMDKTASKVATDRPIMLLQTVVVLQF